MVARTTIATLVMVCSPACGNDSSMTLGPGAIDTGERPDMPDALDSDALDSSDAPSSSEGPASVIDSVSFVENPANALSYFVEWDTEPAAPSEVRVVCGDDIDYTLLDSETVTEHRAFVMGLYEGADCRLAIWARPVDAPVDWSIHQITLSGLPDVLPPLGVTAESPALVEEGWTLHNNSNQVDGVRPQAVLIDPQGRPRWYFQRSIAGSGSEVDVTPLDGGLLYSGNTASNFPMILGWDGRIIWEADFGMHHDIRAFPEPGHIMYLSQTRDCLGEVLSDTVVQRDLTHPDETIVWEWKICEYYTPPVAYLDWAHMNTIESFPGEQAILLSVRNQNTLLKVELESGDIVWSMGYNGAPEDGFNGDFAMGEDDRCLHQHAPEILANGNIVVFDNGLRDVREYSRAIEISYDEVEMTAEVVWEYRYEPDSFAPTWSEADRLSNGNTLITFGVRNRNEQAHLVEVSAAGDVVWDVTFPQRWSSYRAERITPVFGYVGTPPVPFFGSDGE